MPRYVEAEALALKVRRQLIPGFDDDGTVNAADAERYFLSLLENAPTADVQEVRHGRWEHSKTYSVTICSECGDQPNCFEPDYCNNCGARMDMESIYV